MKSKFKEKAERDSINLITSSNFQRAKIDCFTEDGKCLGYVLQFDAFKDAVKESDGRDIFICHPRLLGKFKVEQVAKRIKQRKRRTKK